MSTKPSTKNPRTRSDVRRKYGHPWPWVVPELFREHVIESDDQQKAIAEKWLTNADTLRKWRKRHGFNDGEGSA